MNWADQRYAIGRGIAAIRHLSNSQLQPLVRGAIEHQLPGLLAAATGSTFPNVSGPMLGQLVLPKLDAFNQLTAAEILGAIDDKIELNRRMNETLERMSQAIFRDWFVDFGPVRRKLAGATDPVEIMGALTSDSAQVAKIAALFPNGLDDGGKPEGWGYSTLDEQFDIKIGRTPPRKEVHHFVDEGQGEPWISIRDMGQCGAFIVSTAEGLTPASVAAFRVPPIPDSTVVVSFKLTVGRVSMTVGQMYSNEAIAQLRTKPGSPSAWFAYCWMKSYDYGRLGSTSSIATAVNSNSIKSIEIPVAPTEIMRGFDAVAERLFERIRAATLENRTLAETRDYLLPRLMSGSIRLAS